MSQAQRLRSELAYAEARVNALRTQVGALERLCSHAWTEPTSKIEYYKEWEHDLTRPRFQGVDLMGYEGREVEKSRTVWTRSCPICLKVEKTTKTAEEVIKKTMPQF